MHKGQILAVTAIAALSIGPAMALDLLIQRDAVSTATVALLAIALLSTALLGVGLFGYTVRRRRAAQAARAARRIQRRARERVAREITVREGAYS
jgi:hypothetical protein